MNNLYKIIILLFLLLSSCISSNKKTTPLNKSKHFNLIKKINVTESDSTFIGTVSAVDVRLNPLRFYIADREMHRVAVVTEHVAIADGRVTVNQARNRGIDVFEDNGEYIETYHLPEGHWYGGVRDFIATQDGGYILPLSGGFNPTETRSVKASPEESTVARLNSEFKLVDTFGEFPELYQNGDYIARQRTVDVNSDSLAAVGYSLTPDVQIYDLKGDPNKKAKDVSLSHPNFKAPREEISWSMARNSPDEAREALANVSTVEHTYLLDNGIVIQNFHNPTLDYYQEQFDESDTQHYAIVGHIESEEQENVILPGRILTSDEEDRVYVELDPTPDQRKIGVYEVVGWDD